MEEKIKVTHISYKLSKKAKKVSAFQIRYNHGIQTLLIKSKGETEDDLLTVTLTKKQWIAKMSVIRTDKTTKEYRFIDQHSNDIVRLPFFSHQSRDCYGRYKEDSIDIEILDGNIFIYKACGHHEKGLLNFIC